MKPRVNLVIGAVSIVVVAVILMLVLRSCARGDSYGRISEDEANPNRHLTSCEAERETGTCNPPAKRTKGYFDWDAFMAMVRENQSDASYPYGRSGAGAVYSSYSSVASSASSLGGSATAIVRIVGGPSASSSRSSARSRSARWGSTGGGSSGIGGAGDFNGGGFDGRDFGGDEDGRSDGGSGDGNFDGDDGRDGDGSQGDREPLPSGKCARGRSLLAIFDTDDITSGENGWTFPVLIDGNCPVSAAILKGPESGDGFGGRLNDF